MLKRIHQLRKAPSAVDEKDRLIEEIREVRRQIGGVQALFAMETDEDLLDAAIYQHEALEARHRYLLRLAREQDATAPPSSAVVSEPERMIN